MTRFPKEMTENGIHYTLHGDYYFPDLDLPDSPAAMAGCGKPIWKSIVPDCMNGFFFPVSCMTIWRKQIKSAGIVWNR